MVARLSSAKCAALLLAVLVAGGYAYGLFGQAAPPDSPKTAREDAKPAGSLAAILEAFDRYPLVALAESHGLEEEREFICSLVRDARFAAKVNYVVVEFGNAKYQDTMDRYVAGEDVPAAELQRVWREHTCPGPWLSSAYPKYFAAFREANKGLPPSKRFRVLLGDPPIDWTAVGTREDFGRILSQRDAHFARVVEENVLAKGAKALLILGSGHLLRMGLHGPIEVGARSFPGASPAGGKQEAEAKDHFGPVTLPGGPRANFVHVEPSNVASIIDRHYPGKLFVVLPHDGLGVGSAEMEKQFAAWPVPALALLKGTNLGASAANQVMPRPKLVKMFKDGKVFDPPQPDPAKGPRLEDIADALLYLGPRETLTLAQEVDCSSDRAFLTELQRRRGLSGALESPADAARKHSRRYIDQ